MNNLFEQIDEALKKISHGWTSHEKAQAMASCILALRPLVSVEIGVYAGKGLISMGLAHKHLHRGTVMGIDPYSALVSAEGQIKPIDKEWWGKLDHEAIYKVAKESIEQLDLEKYVQLIRKKSDDVTPPKNIGVLRIDGNHGEQAIRDVKRFCPFVISGGFLFLDDLDWPGGSVNSASKELSESEQWRELYSLDDGKVYQKL
jgi:hypothetical protein